MTTERYIKGPGIEVASGLDEKLITKQVLFNALYEHYTKYDEQVPMHVKKENGHCVVPLSVSHHMVFKPAESLDDLTVQRELEFTRELLDEYFLPRLPEEDHHFYSIQVTPVIIGETDEAVDYAVDTCVIRSAHCTYSEFAQIKIDSNRTLTRGEWAKRILEFFVLNSRFYFHDMFRRKPLTFEQNGLYSPLVHKGQQLLEFLQRHPDELQEGRDCIKFPGLYEELFLDDVDTAVHQARRFHSKYMRGRTNEIFTVTCRKRD